MNNDPFAQSQPPEFLPDEATLPQRTSIMAILSLVFSLICCIPGLGAIGAILGGVSLISISRSNGRLTGTGLAVTGIVIGLLVSIVWIGSAALASSGFGSMINQADGVMAAAEANDATALRSAVVPPASAVTDAEIDAFRAAYQAQYGGYVGASRGLLGQAKALLDQGATLQTALNRVQGQYPTQTIVPIVAQFDQGDALLIMVAEPQPGAPPAPANIGVVAPDGSMIWLLDPTGVPTAPAGP